MLNRSTNENDIREVPKYLKQATYSLDFLTNIFNFKLLLFFVAGPAPADPNGPRARGT